MPIIEWHDRVYTMGIDEVDRQHRSLVGMINDAYDAALGGVCASEIRTLVDRMVGYAEGHFATEEELMKASGYHQAEGHFAEHGSFVRKAQSYTTDLQGGHEPDPSEVFRYLAEWLSAHILEVDMAFGRWLKGERERPA